MRIVTLLLFLAVLGLAGSALAGPNAGGTLIVHDPSMTYTSEGAPFPGPAPTLDPPTVDNELPVGVPPDGPGWVWKVYAAFPIGSSPRLKAFVMGAQFGGDVVVLDGGLPGPLDFELPQDGWPTTTGGGVGISFYPLRTDPVVECYWFGGYGELGGIWALAPHPTQQMIFVDDTSPPQEDPIAGLSTIGFGVAGETVYPGPLPVFGACCYPDGHCEFLEQNECATGDWWEGPCDPNPCPHPPAGACCQPDGTCDFIPEEACPTGDWREGVPCAPNPCPTLAQGACCYPDGHCVYTYEANCSTGDWREGVACQPNPCPAPPTGACCYGFTCYVLSESECTGAWQGAGTVCDPNPCCRRTVQPPGGPKDPIAKSEVGPGRGVLAPAQRDNPCPYSELYLNFDGSAEDGYAWQYGGIVPPDFGSFAEGFDSIEGYVCGVQLLLTQTGNATGQPIDVYVWDMDGECGIPGAVLSVTTPVVVSGVAFWPSFSAHDIDTVDAWVHGDGFYVGYWSGGWQGGLAGFYCVADLDGFGGMPRTNIAPGIGYPTGWQDPSIVWGGTQALGIGAYCRLWVIPTVPTSWGKIKVMYR